MKTLTTLFFAVLLLMTLTMAAETFAQSSGRPNGGGGSTFRAPKPVSGSSSRTRPAGSSTSRPSSGTSRPSGSTNRRSQSSSKQGGSDNKQGGSNNKTEELPPLGPEALSAMKQFEQTRNTMTSNKRQIDKLYRTVPIGFVEKQKAHMDKLKQLEADNRVLANRIVDEAVELFRLAPGYNKIADELVKGQIQEALEPRSADSRFNPKLALELCSLMLSEDNLPWKILIRAFRASYALQDFERAQLILDRLGERGKVRPIYGQILEKTSQKWQEELLVRRLESQTGDLPIATFKTTEGIFRTELFENQAPLTVNNFVALAEEGFYDGRAFFQVIPSEYAASGSINDDGTGTVGYSVKGEANREKSRSHFAGTLSMIPNSLGNTGAKFLICHQPKTELDSRFTAFGRVMSEEGLQVVYKLATHDATNFQTQKTKPSKILSVTIENKRAHQYLKTPVNPAVTTDDDESEGVDVTEGIDDDDTPSSFDLLQKNN